MEFVLNDIVVDVSQIIKRRNKKIYLHFYKPNIIKITTPYKLSNDKIMEYLNSSYKYIKKRIDYTEKPKENVLHLFGEEYNVKIVDAEESYVECDGKYIIIHKNESDDERKLEYNYYLECLKHFITRYLEEAKSSLNINRIITVKYKDVKTYFGICTPKKNQIGFAIKLAKYDPILIKSVLYHELCHFYFLNHQKGFYKLIENVFPNYKHYQHLLRSTKYNDLF